MEDHTLPYFYMDSTFFTLVIPTFIFALWAQHRVKTTFNKYQKQYSSRHITGREAAERILRLNGLSHIRIERISGHLSDHYDPRDNVIRLSSDVYDSTSTAAIGVAAHEVGHAIQHAQEYFPLKLRNLIIPATNFGSRLAFPLFIIGLIFSSYDPLLLNLAYIGVFFFFFSVLFQLITLPTEFDASKRAMISLEQQGILDDEELYGARKVLQAAAMTYVAALAVSLAQMLRLLAILNNRR